MRESARRGCQAISWPMRVIGCSALQLKTAGVAKSGGRQAVDTSVIVLVKNQASIVMEFFLFDKKPQVD